MVLNSIRRKVSSHKHQASQNQVNVNAPRSYRDSQGHTVQLPSEYASNSPMMQSPPSYTSSTYSSSTLSPGTSYSQTDRKRRSPSPMPTASTADDPYAFLSSFDTVFLIDDSASMGWGNSWKETGDALASITPICTAHDSDGIDVYFLNTKSAAHHRNITTAGQVIEIFQTVRPRGGTPTGQRLNDILKPYMKHFEELKIKEREDECKPLNVIVITDGMPSDDVESVIVKVAQKLDQLEADPWQIGIQFFQVGDDAGATKHLASLDDDLAGIGGGCRDIVDTVPMQHGAALTADGILKTVLGAVNKRLDRVKM